MATGTKLIYTFVTAEGKNAQLSFNYADPASTKAEVLALGNAIIDNVNIYATEYVSIKQIKTQTTSEQTYDLTAEGLKGIPTELASKVNIEAGEPLEDEEEMPKQTQTVNLTEGKTLSEILQEIRNKKRA